MGVKLLGGPNQRPTIDLDGNTHWIVTTADENADDTVSAADLTKLAAVTATATELNYVDGVTSSVQTQLDTLDQRADVLQYRKPTIIALGDSITSNGYNSNGAGPRSWLMHACVASGGKLHLIDHVGTGGATTAQILSTLIPIVLTLDPRPGYCCVLAGANDTNTTSFASWSASYTSILDALEEAGIMPVICPIVPSDTTAKHEDAATWNAWLNLQAKARGIPYIDWLGDLMDPATGGSWLAGLETDGTHPDAAGAVAMGGALWRELQPWIDAQPVWKPYLATSNTDPTNLHSNGLFLTDTNADGLADNWDAVEGGGGAFTAYMTPTLENPASSDCIGKWQQCARISTGASYFYLRGSASITVAAGDKLSVAYRLKTADLASSGVALGGIGLYEYNQSTVPVGNVDGAAGTRNRWGTSGWAHDIDAMTFYQELTVKSSATATRFILNLADAASGTISIAQLTVRNLTDLGID